MSGLASPGCGPQGAYATDRNRVSTLEKLAWVPFASEFASSPGPMSRPATVAARSAHGPKALSEPEEASAADQAILAAIRSHIELSGTGLRRRGSGESTPLLVRALGLDRGVKHVIDATAGYGRDAALLAARGARVVLIERHPLLARALQEALARLRELGDPIAERLSIRPGDACRQLRELPDAELPDAVYLDPMFPVTGKTALPSQSLQLLRELLHDEPTDAAELLALARRVARRRVVVKRPIKAAPLAEGRIAKLVGQQLRFDVYAPLPRASGDAGSAPPSPT